MDSRLSRYLPLILLMLTLERFGTDIPQRRRTPLPIVPDFNPPEDRCTRLFPRCVRITMDQLALQGAEETLRRRVVITVSLPAHAAFNASFGEKSLIVAACILTAAIAVTQQTRTRTTSSQSALVKIPTAFFRISFSSLRRPSSRWS